jgi:hypothetical protein
MSGALSEAHWGVHAGHDVWAQRNYPCDNLIGAIRSSSPQPLSSTKNIF